jgi:integrase
VRRSFEYACRKAQIEGLRFHDLRHTFASRLIEKGVDIIKVKDLLGHSSVKVTERYTHSNRDERKKAVELLCEKPLKRGKKPVNLLHNRYTEEDQKISISISSLFSVN